MAANSFDLKTTFLGNHDLAQINDLNSLISAILPNIYTIAGVLLLLYGVFGGFVMITASGNPVDADRGKQIMTNAIIGFVIIFASYWIIQAIEILTGITIL